MEEVEVQISEVCIWQIIQDVGVISVVGVHSVSREKCVSHNTAVAAVVSHHSAHNHYHYLHQHIHQHAHRRQTRTVICYLVLIKWTLGSHPIVYNYILSLLQTNDFKLVGQLLYYCYMEKIC